MIDLKDWKPIDTAPYANEIVDEQNFILVGFQGQFGFVQFFAYANGPDTFAPGYARPTHWRKRPESPVGLEFIPSNR